MASKKDSETEPNAQAGELTTASSYSSSNTESVFEAFETEFQIKVPEFLKNLLIFTGYDNAFIIQDLDSNSLTAIENIARSHIPNLFQGSLEQYLGHFHTKPNEFFIMPGHKKLLEKLSNYAKKQMAKKTTENMIEDDLGICNKERAQKNNVSNEKKTILKSERQKRYPTKESINIIVKDGGNSSENVREKASRWLKEFIKTNLKDAGVVDILNKIDTIKIKMLSPNMCYITCFVCKNDTKIYKNKDSWTLSNFHKHFKTHFRDLKENIKRRKSASILNFLRWNTDTAGTSKLINNETRDEELSPLQDETLIDISSENSSTTSQNCFIDESPSALALATSLENDEVSLQYPQESQVAPHEEAQVESQYTIGIPTNLCLTMSDSAIDLNNQDFCNGRSTQGESGFCFNMNSPQKSVDRNWKHPFYSRQQRTQRNLAKCASDNLYLTDFFPIVETIRHNLENYISNNSDRIEVGSPLFIPDEVSKETYKKKVNNLISLLIRQSNDHAKYKGQRYEKQLKEFCCYLYIIGGKLLYETIHANLKNIIPSFRVIKREIEDNQNINEGKLRFEELVNFLEERHYPKHIWISEDQTAINSRIEYEHRSNQVIGFTPTLDSNGMPILNSFPFNYLSDLKNYFDTKDKSNYINIIMAQPLVDQAPAFCLCIYGTCNKFNAKDVEKRWNYLVTTAKEYGITIEGFSTDGDPRMLKTMKQLTELSNTCQNNSNWKYIKDMKNSPLCMQDAVHIGTKLKTVFLKENIQLRIGRFDITPEHIRELIETVSKDKHCLTDSILNSGDKMNFDAVEKLADPKVTSALEQHIKQSEATIAFLKVLKDILDTFLKKSLTPKDRCYKMWHATFFFRIWRNWIISSEFSLTKNFISLNCYSCIELNAHCLTEFMKRQELFLPWLASSQPCEKMFRKLRSLTTTYSTIVNFSVLEVLRRLNRIDLIYKITCDVGRYYYIKSLVFLSFKIPNRT